MNFFFGFASEEISSQIVIPKFNYMGKRILENSKVISLEPNNLSWKLHFPEFIENKNFFFIKKKIDNKKIFFLIKKDKIKIYFKDGFIKELINFENYFDKDAVEFRSNLKILIQNGGYSSYQSDYNFNMCNKVGDILSPLSTLLNINAEQNFIIFRNISTKPLIKSFRYFFICKKTKKILHQGKIWSNYSNKINVYKEFIQDSVYFFSESLIGIPIYVSIKDGHVSMEHTHPPHQYILSADKFKVINNLKKEFKKILEDNLVLSEKN